MAIRQLVKGGVKGKFVCLPARWGWRWGWQSPGPASASCYCWGCKALLYCLWYSLSSSGMGAQAEVVRFGVFFPQQYVCVTRPRGLLCWDCFLVGWEGTDPLRASLCPLMALAVFRGGDAWAGGAQSKTLWLLFMYLLICVCDPVCPGLGAGDAEHEWQLHLPCTLSCAASLPLCWGLALWCLLQEEGQHVPTSFQQPVTPPDPSN